MHGDNGGTLIDRRTGTTATTSSRSRTSPGSRGGSLSLTVRGGEVVDARLKIFEAPRYFERLVVGRTATRSSTSWPRICGICPIAYQMSAVHAFEDLYGIEVDPQVRALRRVLYCGEWIQSHALHVFMLHAPDFLGYPCALEMAADHREIVEDGARDQEGRQPAHLGDRRPADPSRLVRVGGFSRAPRKADLEDVRQRARRGRGARPRDRRLVATWTPPELDNPQPLVAMRHPAEYPFNDGRIVSTDGLDIAPQAWGTRFEELHLEGTNALHARTLDGEVYLLGPTARIALTAETLHPLAFEALTETGLRDAIRVNIHRSIVARSVELLHALAEARDLIDGYVAAERAPGRVDAQAGHRRLVHRGPARPPPPSLRGRRARATSSTRRSSRRPARTRVLSRPTSRRSRRPSSACPTRRPPTSSRC